MATRVIRRGNERLENLFFPGMVVLFLTIVFVGFARSYYLAGPFKAPLPNLLVHIHGAVFSVWFLLLIAQTSLVAADRVDVHRRLGLLGFTLACLMVILGLLAATDLLGRMIATGGPGMEFRAKAFYAIPLADMLAFATLIYFAFRNRSNPAAHKRLILIATIALLVTAFSRFPIPVALSDHRIAQICCYPLLLLMMGYDLVQRQGSSRHTLGQCVPIRGATGALSHRAKWALAKFCYLGICPHAFFPLKAKSTGALSLPVDKGSPSQPLFAFWGPVLARYEIPSQALIAWVEGVW